MEWGDVPAWAALVLSVGAFIVSLKARGDGRRSADAAATAAEASVRSADAAEAALAHEQSQAQERRLAEAEAARPKVELAIHHLYGTKYRIVNDGQASANAVMVSDRDLPTTQNLSPGVPSSLAAGEGRDFTMAGGWGRPVPPQLFVRWQDQDDWIPLRVPSRY
ncbi:hypothetical protein [Streptomyces violascens]|uniref:Secreted protein n=1 Tax=Streptomyces violascens TaxID=67381 RepID=A0ABQ3QX81_9ACTN|nr:hypothetical protein [Streptomyces violascens]GGU13092.1 hypothetical protein GCM10010289_38410 [Streptomyces violascens]GHI41891.1 hypothetical protein Sviol_62990 [Streptomyces violascens]